MSLTPYDDGSVLEPQPWRQTGDLSRYGKVDFDNDESGTQLTLKCLPIQRGVRVEIDAQFDGIVQVVVDGRVVDIRTAY